MGNPLREVLLAVHIPSSSPASLLNTTRYSPSMAVGESSASKGAMETKDHSSVILNLAEVVLPRQLQLPIMLKRANRITVLEFMRLWSLAPPASSNKGSYY